MCRHIIHKQKVTLQINRLEDAWNVQNRVSKLMKEDMLRHLELLFDELVPGDELLRIETMEINLGEISAKSIEPEITQKMMSQLRDIIIQKKSENTSEFIKNNNPVIEKKQSLFEMLIYFLDHGCMPWYSTVINIVDWEEEIIQSFSEKEWNNLSSFLSTENGGTNFAYKRLAYQFSNTFPEKFLLCVSGLSISNWKKIYNDVLVLGIQKHLIWQTALEIATSIDADNFGYNFLKKILSEPETRKEIKDRLLKENNFNQIQSGEIKSALNKILREDIKLDELAEIIKDNKKRPQLPKTEEALFIANSGLVILHPFLQMYFEGLGLVEKRFFKNEALKRRAVLLLQYLVTGETVSAETQLLLPKLICNINFEEPVENEIKLTEQEINESDNLLKAVLKYWTPLSRTSVKNLQETFLQHEGKLSQAESNWVLQVERKTVDILLNQLPWNISVIKLPWMNNYLNIEWS